MRYSKLLQCLGLSFLSMMLSTSSAVPVSMDELSGDTAAVSTRLSGDTAVVSAPLYVSHRLNLDEYRFAVAGIRHTHSLWSESEQLKKRLPDIIREVIQSEKVGYFKGTSSDRDPKGMIGSFVSLKEDDDRAAAKIHIHMTKSLLGKQLPVEFRMEPTSGFQDGAGVVSIGGENAKWEFLEKSKSELPEVVERKQKQKSWWRRPTGMNTRCPLSSTTVYNLLKRREKDWGFPENFEVVKVMFNSDIINHSWAYSVDSLLRISLGHDIRICGEIPDTPNQPQSHPIDKVTLSPEIKIEEEDRELYAIMKDVKVREAGEVACAKVKRVRAMDATPKAKIYSNLRRYEREMILFEAGGGPWRLEDDGAALVSDRTDGAVDVNRNDRGLGVDPETMLSSFHLLMFAAVLIVGLSHLLLITAAPVASVTNSVSVHHPQAVTSYGFLGFHYVPQEVAEEYIIVRALTTAAVIEQHPYAALSDKSRPPGTSTTYWECLVQYPDEGAGLVAIDQAPKLIREQLYVPSSAVQPWPDEDQLKNFLERKSRRPSNTLLFHSETAPVHHQGNAPSVEELLIPIESPGHHMEGVGQFVVLSNLKAILKALHLDLIREQAKNLKANWSRWVDDIVTD
ncbi:hypothetical protein EV360DRAFT_74395 [Lentinula raphanica]|nr:hypothetical protein EV360DRAFT_74395 [Lentinula raphanica]